MNMKKWFILTVLLGAMPLSMLAQDDDMYFVPTKSNSAKAKASYGVPRDTYYSGSNRSVDEYNRRGSYYETIPGDSLGDIIDFSAVQGVYPDSIGEYDLTRKMQRWDGYEPSEVYAEGYVDGRRDSWHSPWYWHSYYPWYDSWYYGSYWGWYDPWYYGGYWYDPWYYSSWGWGYPYYYRNYWYGGGYYGGGYAHRYYSGSRNHGTPVASGSRGFGNGRSTTYSSGTFGGSRVGSFGGNRTSAARSSSNSTSSSTRAANTSRRVYSNSNGNFGGSLSNSSSGSSSSVSSTRSVISSGSSGGGGGSFGGSRSGGGGGRSGGSFGGGRR